MRPYLLKRKDLPLAVINISEEGAIRDYKIFDKSSCYLPLHDPNSNDWLKKWWNRRAVPVEQGHIRQMLQTKGLISSEDYLVKNLGLSLTDYYWISPVNSGLEWDTVNLFDNDFHDDINIANEQPDRPNMIPHYTPNGSLQGSLEKCWTIRNGKRGMIKGNRDSSSAESLNEILASKLHEMQGFDNYTPYKLIKINGREYEYGCYSELFTSGQIESISAYDIVTSEKQPADVNSYEHFINVCSNHGLPSDELRSFLEYQIMTDFIISGRDRHLSNISILRNSDTLEFIKPAPIYDSGKSMFVNDIVPDNDKDMLKIHTESFASTELKLLSFVRDRLLVDITKLPSVDFIKELYSLDSNMTDSRIKAVISGYERKIDLFIRWQKGENIKEILYNSKREPNISNLSGLFI